MRRDYALGAGITIGAVLIAVVAFTAYLYLHVSTRDARVGATKLQILQMIDEKRFDDASALLERAERHFGRDLGLIELSGDIATLEGRYREAGELYSEAIAMLDSAELTPRQRAERMLLDRKRRAVEEGRPWTREEIFRRETDSHLPGD